MIAERLARVRERMHQAAEASGRAPEELQLVAVSKTHPPDAIEAAYAAGQRHFGESYAQELRDKARALAHLSELRWHYIGRIQSNKARYIGPVAHRVHALTSARHARKLARRAPEGLSVLVHVDVVGETSKGGVPPTEALERCAAIAEVGGIALRGLMALPPLDADPRPSFRTIAELAREGRARGLPLHELSMGMSQDYEQAIACGATWLRIGTAIFGPR